MAASAATASSSPGLCPNYAAICSFLERYGALLDLPELTFPQLEQYLRDTAAVPKLLVDLHVKLLRKIGKSVSADRWEKYLVKICQDLNTTWAWELEQNGYKELTTECKTGILKYLCECQFDDNVKFKTAINEEDPEKMRLQPIGRDKDGQMYWFQLDQEDNVRVYLEEQDDLDGSSWRCIVRDRNDLAEVLALLKTQIDPELLKKDQENKPEGEVKKVEDTSDEDVKDAAKAGGPVSPKTEDAEKAPSVDDVKSEAPDAKLSQNGVVEGESRSEPDSEKSAADPGGGAKAPNIKEEPMEEAPPTDARTVAAAASEPVVPETPSLPVKVEKRDEAKKSSAEEIQQALKNDQQAKIPLKKRGMKFSEDFEKNSGGGIIVPNPAAPQVKDAAKVEPPKRAQVVNVNGDVQPAAEKLQSLKDADKEPAAEPAEGKSVETRDKDSPLPREEEEKKEEEEGRKDEAHSAEKNKEDSGKKDPDVPVEPESAAPKGKTEPPKEPALLPGDAAEKPSGQEERGKVKETAKDETSRKTGDSDRESKDVGSRDPEGVKKEEETRAARKAEKGTPGVIKATTACEDKKSADSVSVFLMTDAVIKKTDVLKDGGDDAVRKVCEKSGGESVGSSVIKKLDGSRKPAEKHGGAEEAETSRKPVDCEAGTRRDGSKMSADEPGPGEARAAALKEDPKPRDGGKAEDSVTRKRTEETSSCAAEETSAAKGSDTKTEGSDRETKRTEEDVNVEAKKDTDKEAIKNADKEKTKDTDKEKTKDADKEKTKDADKEKTKDADKTKDTDKEKDTDVEKPRNGSEKLCPDEENENDSTTEKRSKPDETKANKRALMETETSTKSGKSAPQKASEEVDGKEVDGKEVGGKEVDGKCSEEAQKDGRPNAVPEAEKPAGEDGKSKSEDEDSAAKKDEVANGGEALTSRRKVRPRGHRRKVRLQREARLEDSESDANTGRSLRRSPRISRPTAKAVEIHDRKLERSQAAEEEEEEEKDEEAEKEKEKGEEEEEEEEDEVKAVQKKPREKKVFQEGQPKPKGRKRRRVRWSNTRTRRKKKGSEDDDSEESSSEDEEEEEESEDDSDEDYKVERSKKRRNRHRERRSSDSSTSTDDDMPPNDDPCKHCGLPNHPELILLCDSCDSGYHTACLRPPLMIIPDGEWFCSPCQHKLLCDKLEEQLTNLDAALKKKERAERRKERLIYVGISLENIITPGEVEEEKPEIIIKEKKESKRSKSWGRRSTRKKKSISYRFDEFDEAIEEAIEEDIKEAEGGGAGRGKDMANITGHRGKDMSTILQADEGKENVRPPPAPLGPRRKKRRRLNDLDSDSTVDEEESEDEFRISESSEEEFVVSENESEGDSESNSEFDGKAKRRDSSRHKKKSLKRRRSARKRRRPRGYSDDEEEETDEEDEDEMVTEGSSEYSDSDLDMSRRRSRRSQKKRVNYHETSESEGSRAETKQARMRPGRRRDSSDSEASFSKGSEEESRDRRLKRKADSSEEDSRQRRRRLALKRRRASEDDDSSDDSSSEDRPIRKRVNRIDSDDSEEEEEEKKEEKEENAEEEKKQQDGEQKEDKTKEKKTTDEESKGTKLADGDAADGDAAPTNGQKSPVKSSEGAGGRPAAGAAHPDPPKNIGAAPNGQEMAPQDEDEDDLLGVTDLVDYVCNNEDL